MMTRASNQPTNNHQLLQLFFIFIMRFVIVTFFMLQHKNVFHFLYLYFSYKLLVFSPFGLLQQRVFFFSFNCVALYSNVTRVQVAATFNVTPFVSDQDFFVAFIVLWLKFIYILVWTYKFLTYFRTDIHKFVSTEI